MEDKWQGTMTSPKLLGVTPAQAWAVVGDYYNFQKFIPSIVHSCSKVTDSCDGKPGSFRYSTFTLPGTTLSNWIKDQLVAVDQEGMSYTFEIVENSIGLGKCVLTLRVATADGDGCVIEWLYDCEPSMGWTEATLAALLLTAAAEMATVVGVIVAADKLAPVSSLVLSESG